MKTIVSSLIFLLSAIFAFVSLEASAEDAVGGDETNVDVVVPAANAWTILTAEPFQIAANVPTHCVATGSADALNPNNGVNRRYLFALSIDNAAPAPDGPCERTVEFDNNNNASAITEVSSTCTFRNIAMGNHTIFWLARKNNAGFPNLMVADNSFTFVCQEDLLDGDGEGDGGGD